MLKDFYISFSAVCFTLLGLWLIVVQTRHAEWRGSAPHRRRAYGVALHFSLPGLMSLLALVNPDSSALWRTSFAIVAIGGAVVLIAVRGATTGTLGLTAYIFAIALYTLIGSQRPKAPNNVLFVLVRAPMPRPARRHVRNSRLTLP